MIVKINHTEPKAARHDEIWHGFITLNFIDTDRIV
jgi:hypothetical protein